ncbi:hypothetical protein DKX38_024590 [Salix brachista]|uniref:Uncharacterized protein n=1 Tax=Salix brachista TaxID=2182728 RepID=A0A5N5JLP3_9ROSI|nr:hypothetical protein DKX38_024590 [Salix brachista]
MADYFPLLVAAIETKVENVSSVANNVSVREQLKESENETIALVDHITVQQHGKIRAKRRTSLQQSSFPPKHLIVEKKMSVVMRWRNLLFSVHRTCSCVHDTFDYEGYAMTTWKQKLCPRISGFSIPGGACKNASFSGSRVHYEEDGPHYLCFSCACSDSMLTSVVREQRGGFRLALYPAFRFKKWQRSRSCSLFA